MRVLIHAVGLIGPGLPNWATGAAALCGAAPYIAAPVQLPPLEALPAAERRRTGAAIRLALTTGLQTLANAGLGPAEVITVFTSSGGDGQVIHEICDALAGAQRDVSPTRFHNSVHNAPAGYWGIATRSHAASTSLCAFDGSFAAGLLEACAQAATGTQPVLLISHDLPYPEPLNGVRPVHEMLGVGLLLSSTQVGGALASLELELRAHAQDENRMSNPELEKLRGGNPTGRSLPLLETLAAGTTRELALEYLDSALTLRISRA
jgi:hypothetical protein